MNEEIPMKIFRLGEISLLVWGADTQRIEIKRAQKNPSGEWEYTTEFGREDLPKIQLLTSEAYVWVERYKQGGFEAAEN